MKSKVMDRPMFRKGQGKEMDPENVGIMQGFADMMDEEMPEDENEDEGEDREDEDEGEEGGEMEERSPKSPEILMNNLRGDMRSIDARVEELADLVGYNAAVNTPTEVLALLQPVLAAEAQQGIGALPQGMPPGMPPAAPPGMPPGAPGGIEALMAGAGGPPGMPPGMPPAPGPVNMAAGGYVRGYKSGGYVQHFQEGSDEEGVTPVEELPSGPGAYSPEMIARARTEVANFLSRQPLTVPDLATVTAQRVPMYEKLLGVDKNLSQGQMLFDIAQAAFNFAGNVDEQGRPLTGSLMSRLGRAAAPLPAKVGARVAEQAKADQMIKLTALQAAEKDVSDIRAQNAKLVESQRKAWSDIMKASTMDKGFGTGKEGQILNYFVKYAPEYAAGTLSDEMSRRFETAVRDYTQRKEIETIDPVTGNKSIRTVQNQLPTFVTEALKGRNKLEALTSVGTGGTGGKTTAPTPEAKPAWLNEPPAGGATTQPVPAPAAPAAPPAAGPAQGGTPPAQGETPPAENRLAIPNYSPVDPLQVNPRTQSYFTQANPTMFGASFRGTGIPSAVGSFAYRIPFVGPALGSKEMAEARDYLESATNRINRAIATSPRFAETERQQIQKQLDLMPAIFDNPTAYRSRLFVLDDFLSQLQEEALRNTFNDQLTVQQRQQAREKATDIHGMREIIGSPLRIYSATDPRLQTLPNGTPFLWNGEEWRMIQRKQGAR